MKIAARQNRSRLGARKADRTCYLTGHVGRLQEAVTTVATKTTGLEPRTLPHKP